MRRVAVIYLMLCCFAATLWPLQGGAMRDALLGRGVAGCAAKDKCVRLLFMGDIMGHMPQVNAARQSDGNYDFSSVFRYVKPMIEHADLSVANLETTLSVEPPYSGYPRFCSPASLAEAMRSTGVDVVLTANNHALDCGADGVRKTLQVLDDCGLMHTGTSGDSLYSAPLMVECQGVQIAILNYTFSTNGIALPDGVGVNMIDKERIAADLQDCASADIRVACLHWGVEYATTPNREQCALASWLRNQGVDVVVGSHPHTVQRVECDGEGVVIYSLGNFVSNQRMEGTDEGIMVEVECHLRRDNQNESFFTDIKYSANILPIWVRHRDYAVIPTALASKGLMH